MFDIDDRPTGKASQIIILACLPGHAGEVLISLRMGVLNGRDVC